MKVQKKYSIGIVTYLERFESYFIPLVKALMTIFPDTELIVVLNGYFDKVEQKDYLKRARFFLKKYPNIKVIDFEEPQSLSKLWNLTILNSQNDKLLILNDDVKISPWFRKSLNMSGIFDGNIALINRSWSHFLISREIINEIGWFDERFPAIGNEDEDYESRLVQKGIKIKSYKFRQILNVVAIPEKYSYGKDIDLVNVKYVKANQDFFNMKWEVSFVEKSGFHYVEIMRAYLKLKPGMETPNFYENH